MGFLDKLFGRKKKVAEQNEVVEQEQPKKIDEEIEEEDNAPNYSYENLFKEGK